MLYNSKFLFDMAMIVLFPIMGSTIGMTDEAFGIWAETAVKMQKNSENTHCVEKQHKD